MTISNFGDIPLQISDTFRVRTFDIDDRGNLSGSALCRYLLDVAGEHARMLGLDLHSMIAREHTWVLSRFSARLDKVPRLRDKITIETFTAGVERLYALREFRIFDSERTPIGEGSSAWLILRLDTRRPVRPEPFLSHIDISKIPEQGVLPERVPIFNGNESTASFRVRNRDIDANGHVTSASYAEWAIEALPRDFLLSSVMIGITLEYLAETFFSENVDVRAFRTGSSGMEFLHEINAVNDGRILARARTVWRRNRES
jgi:medium-chain acyl-[acyl-carrier-protein] hydrolase